MIPEVIVVGSGAGAMTGAYLAAKSGLRTVVLERTDRLGGTSAYSGAAAWLPGSQVQQRAGIPDSTESARTYLGELLQPDPRVEAFLEQAPLLVERLESDPILQFEWRAFPDYFDRPGRVPQGRSIYPLDLPVEELGDRADLVRPPVERDRRGRGHYEQAPLSAGRALIGRLLLALDRTGNAEVRTGCSVDELLTDSTGRVIGVGFETDGGRAELHCSRGVLLCAGGFERSPELRTEYGVPGRADWSMAAADSNTGAPLLAALRIGAAVENMDQCWWCPGLAMPDGAASFTLGLRGGLLVDQTGRRFANESLPYDQLGRALAAAPERVPSYLIFDSRTEGALPAIAMPGGRPADHVTARTWVRAETLPELAERIGVPADALSASVARFNEHAAAGQDPDFGRGTDEFDRFWADPVLVPVDRPPYLAARVVLADLGTKGGLATDACGRVLRADRSPIPGLYAAGNTAASMTGTVYPGPGAPIGTAMVFAALAVADLTP